MKRVAGAIVASLLLSCVGSFAETGPFLVSDPLDYQIRTRDVDPNRVEIRFEPETRARIRGGQLVSLAGVDLSAVEEIRADIPGAVWEHRFTLSEDELDGLRALGEERTRQELPDLNLFGLLVLPSLEDEEASRARLENLLARLNEAHGVAEAWALPKPELAVIHQARFSAAIPRGGDRITPDFSPMQEYLFDPPVGVAADFAWTVPGGKGEGVKMIDLEFGWLFTHEDLKEAWYYGGPPDVSDHGTAVLGEFGGQHNGFGIMGIAPEMGIGAIRVGDLADAIMEAATVLDPGDLYLIEIQVSGPEGWLPMEWISSVFAAIQTTTALGIICIEAGANGTVDLDDPLYGGLFDRRVRDSGAIMVGAGTPYGLEAEGFTDYGSRMDLQGWGSSIVTTGYGDLQGGPPEEHYTAGFGGTSGASPIVTGSVGALQGQALHLFGTPLTPRLAEEILSLTGSPWVGERQIGERPNLEAARERLLLGCGVVTATVRDEDTSEPMPDMFVDVLETGRFAKTGPEGQVVMQLSAESATFHVSGNFYYTEEDFPFTLAAAESLEINLDVNRAPMGSLEGTVMNRDEDPIEGARIVFPGTPLDTLWSAPDGSYAQPEIPENTGYTAVVGMVPTYGVNYTNFDITAEEATIWNPILMEAETFEDGPAGYTATGEWELGEPTFLAPPPFSGSNCWGTNLDGPYGDLVTSVLTSPVFHLPDGDTLRLSFHHWYWVDSEDGGNVQVLDPDMEDWVTVEPIGGYPDDNIIILIYEPGYNGKLEDWEPAIFPLDQYAGRDFQFRFYFRSTIEGHKVGWYIDDIALETDDLTSVDLSTFTFESFRITGSGPNPAARDARISFVMPDARPVTLNVYDVAGHLVRAVSRGTLPAGVHTLSWDGRDQRGRRVPSGVYLYKLSAGSELRTGRILRIR
jgi:hypothetical protein